MLDPTGSRRCPTGQIRTTQPRDSALSVWPEAQLFTVAQQVHRAVASDVLAPRNPGVHRGRIPAVPPVRVSGIASVAAVVGVVITGESPTVRDAAGGYGVQRPLGDFGQCDRMTCRTA